MKLGELVKGEDAMPVEIKQDLSVSIRERVSGSEDVGRSDTRSERPLAGATSHTSHRPTPRVG